MNLYDKLYNLPTVNCRFFMVYGPRQPSEGEYAIVTGLFLKQVEEGAALTIEGDGRGLHSSTFGLNLSAFCGMGMHLRVVQGVH
jgi:nucleoside-diphosphate-sugar epimerase